MKSKNVFFIFALNLFCLSGYAATINSELADNPFEHLNSAKLRIMEFMPAARFLRISTSDYSDAFGVGKCSLKQLNYQFQDDKLGASAIVSVHENWVSEQCQTQQTVKISDDRFDYPILGAYITDSDLNSLTANFSDALKLAQDYSATIGRFQLSNYSFFKILQPGPIQIYFEFIGSVCDKRALIYVNAVTSKVNLEGSRLPTCK